MHQGSVYDVSESEKNKWSDWPDSQKSKLQLEFDRAWDWLQNQAGDLDASDEGLNYPPENVRDTSNDSAAPHTAISDNDAWEIFVRWVAFQLAVEIGNHVSWSMKDLPDSELVVLLDSSALVRKFTLGYTIATGAPAHPNHDTVEKNMGMSLIAPPWFTYAFLKNNNLIGSDISTTIHNLIDWTSDNLIHFFGAYSYEEMDNHWQYRGNPPITRIIKGTTNENVGSIDQFQHWTAGCHGTAGFFRNVLRAVNIPVYIPMICNHAQIYFPTEGKYIDHGDNPYNLTFKGLDLPGESLLINEEMHKEWFGEGDDNRQVGCDKIGEQVRVLDEET